MILDDFEIPKTDNVFVNVFIYGTEWFITGLVMMLIIIGMMSALGIVMFLYLGTPIYAAGFFEEGRYFIGTLLTVLTITLYGFAFKAS